MSKLSEITISRIIEAWTIFLDTFFHKLDLIYPKHLIVKKMPQQFIDAGFKNCTAIIDATEFKLLSASVKQINSMTFSDYKNLNTGKSNIVIVPHGSLTLSSKFYAGSITNSNLDLLNQMML